MRHSPLRLAVAVLAMAVLVPSARAADAPVFPRGKNNPIVQAVKSTKPSVVTVRVPRPGGGKDMIGTGVIIDQCGLIITNRHVVGNSSHVNVVLHDGATVVGAVRVAESRCDLALVHIETTRPLAALPLRLTETEVGETVIAVGHPYGYTHTVSVGIISALDREITMPTGDSIPGLIQTDASINPGNSGGPLLNIDGELIGINVALREGAQGIAFAINMATVRQLVGKHLNTLTSAGVRHGLRFEEHVAAANQPRGLPVEAAPAAGGVASDRSGR